MYKYQERLIQHLERALKNAEQDSRLWVRREIKSIITRYKAQGAGAQNAKAKAGKPSELKKKEYSYPKDRDVQQPLISRKKRIDEIAASKSKLLTAVAKDGAGETIDQVSDEQIKSRFKDLPEAKKFIEDNGGTINSKAGWEAVLTVIRKIYQPPEPVEGSEGSETPEGTQVPDDPPIKSEDLQGDDSPPDDPED